MGRLPLHEADTLHPLVVVDIRDDKIRSQCLEFNLRQGQVIVVLSRIPHGPCVIQLQGRQIALGEELCRRITVSRRM